MIKKIITGTLLSILVFFSVSFITILLQIGPFHYYKRYEAYKLNVGFPFKYYEQFWMRGNDFPNSGWHINNLFLDCLLTWLVVLGIYLILHRNKGITRRNN